MPPPMAKYLTEFLGTGFLVLIITLAVTQNVSLAPIAIGIGLMTLVYMGGHVSGAHYNPAVTLALTLKGAAPIKQFVPYVAAQCAGALAGAGLGQWLAPGKCAPGPVGEHTLGQVFVAEVAFTFLLALTVIQVATHKATKGNSYYGFAIGAVVLVGAFVIGPVTSAVMNPAVAIGTLVVDKLAGGTGISVLWLYVVSTLLGGAIAAGVARLQGE